jgi:membrane fusion protein (multidrug efflux system)
MGSRVLVRLASALLSCAVFMTACGAGNAKTTEAPQVPPGIAVSAVAALEQPIARFIRATGTLTAEEQADVAAETPGRVVSAPVELGTRVVQGSELIRLAADETEAQLKEAEANAAQIAARLGFTDGAAFDVDAVPEVRSARTTYVLAESEFARIKSLLDQKVVSQSEFEQRRTQMDATRQQYEAARNGAAQLYQSLQAARARVALARKAFTDTVVRAPFTGVVAQRVVSVGDYVTRGMKVAVVVRVNPLRVKLTVPEQFVSAVRAGQPVAFIVDAYPDRQFEGTVRYVSPALEADQRALIIEAAVPNPTGELKPGLFATARIEQPERTPGILVPAAAVQRTGGTGRVFVVNGDHVEERIVTTGQSVGHSIEVTSGLKAGERVATTNVSQLTDGARVTF